MSSADHPLCDVFSEGDLDRLRSGRCVESDGPADPNISGMLTQDYDDPANYTVSLAEWFRQAARHGDEIRCYYRMQLRNNVSNRCAFLQPASELMAAYFLEVQQEFGLRYIPRRRVRTPDFAIHRKGLGLAVEVKTPDSASPPPCGGRPFMPVPSAAPLLRQAMKGARGQFDSSASNLVLVIDYDRPIAEDIALDAAYGDLHLAIPYVNGSPGAPYEARDRNGFFQRDRNTRIGALGILWWIRRAESAGYFIHNAYASKRIPDWAFDPWPQFVAGEAQGMMIWRNRPERR